MTTETKPLRIGDKVAMADTGTVLGRITDRGYTARDRNYDFGVDLAKAGMPFIAGFDADELVKVEE